MDTAIEWSPPTLQDWLDLGNTSPLPEKGGRYQCGCGSYANAFQIVDLRVWVSKPQDWACDGCHSQWKRELTNVTGIGAYDADPKRRKIEHQKWRRDWLIAFGAPQVMIDEVQTRIDELEAELLLVVTPEVI